MPLKWKLGLKRREFTILLLQITGKLLDLIIITALYSRPIITKELMPR